MKVEIKSHSMSIYISLKIHKTLGIS